MYTVLVPIGTTEAGVSRAIKTVSSFPGTDEIEVVIVHVSQDIDFIGSDGSHVSIEHEELNVPEVIEQTIAEFEASGFPVELALREGDTVEEILDTIATRDVDHVIVPDKRRTPIGKVVFGGTTLSLVRDSPAPVTIVPDSVE